MSENRLKRPEAAAKALAEAESIMSAAFPEAPSKPGPLWADWMLYEILRREAAELIWPAGEALPRGSAVSPKQVSDR